MTLRPRYPSPGFSLVELMVAMTIGLIILAAVSLMFANSKKAYEVQNKLARVQENGRFAMNYLLQDMRMAGYIGCPSGITPEVLLPPNSQPSSKFRSTLAGIIVPASAGGTLASIPFAYRFDIPVEGFDGDASPAMTAWAPSSSTTLPNPRVAGTDMIAVRLADATSQVFLTTPMAAEFSDLQVNDVTNYKKSDIVLVTDCDSLSVTQITDIDSGAKKLLHDTTGGFTPGNANKKLAKAYGTETSGSFPADTPLRATKVFKYAAHSYFIRNNADGVPSLYRDTNGANPEELVEGIEDLQILYGVDIGPPADTTGVIIPSRYYRANEVFDWTRVVSVRIGILARTSSGADADVDRNTYDVNGKSVTICPALPAACSDRNQRRVFLATVQLRNFRAPE